MVLTPREAGRSGIVLGQATDTFVALPAIRVLEHLLDNRRVRSETGHEGIDIACIQRPGIARNEVLDRDAILDGQPALLTHDVESPRSLAEKRGRHPFRGCLRRSSMVSPDAPVQSRGL